MSNNREDTNGLSTLSTSWPLLARVEIRKRIEDLIERTDDGRRVKGWEDGDSVFSCWIEASTVLFSETKDSSRVVRCGTGMSPVNNFPVVFFDKR